MYSTMLYYTMLHCTTTLFSTKLYYAVLYYYTVLYYTILCCTVLWCTVLWCTMIYCTMLFCSLVCRTTLWLISLYLYYALSQLSWLFLSLLLLFILFPSQPLSLPLSQPLSLHLSLLFWDRVETTICHFLLSNQSYILWCLPFKESLETMFFHLFIFIYIRAADRFNIGWNKKASGKGKYWKIFAHEHVTLSSFLHEPIE